MDSFKLNGQQTMILVKNHCFEAVCDTGLIWVGFSSNNLKSDAGILRRCSFIDPLTLEVLTMQLLQTKMSGKSETKMMSGKV